MQIDRGEIIELCCDLGIWIDLNYRGDRIEFQGANIEAIAELVEILAQRAAEAEREVIADHYAASPRNKPDSTSRKPCDRGFARELSR